VRSVADDLRLGTLARVLAMSVPARMQLSLSLGDDDLEFFVRSSGMAREDARRHLRAQRQRGRMPSVANDGQ
jgi:hypothetical protein